MRALTGRDDKQLDGPRHALEGLNFFMADMQAGIGPFLGVFLQSFGWKTGAIGTVMTLGGIAGMAVTAPAGALVDATTRKRLYVIVSGICTVLASALIWFSHSFWVVAGSQVATAIAGAAIGPAVIGITLGIFRQAGFNRQNGRNQAFNHAGNMVGEGLSGLLGWKFGFAGRVLACGRIRHRLDRFRLADPQQIPRRSGRARPAGRIGRRRKGQRISGAVRKQAALFARHVAGAIPPRQWCHVAALRSCGGRGPPRQPRRVRGGHASLWRKAS